MNRIIIAQYDTQTKMAFDSGNTEGLELVFGPIGCICAPGLGIDEQLKFVSEEQKKGIDALVFSNHGSTGLNFAEKLPASIKPKSILVFQSEEFKDYFKNHREPLFKDMTFEEAYGLLYGIFNVTYYETLVEDVKKCVEERK